MPLQLVVCGQALSHCVNFTVRDIHARVVETGDLQASDMYLLADGEGGAFLALCAIESSCAVNVLSMCVCCKCCCECRECY